MAKREKRKFQDGPGSQPDLETRTVWTMQNWKQHRNCRNRSTGPKTGTGTVSFGLRLEHGEILSPGPWRTIRTENRKRPIRSTTKPNRTGHTWNLHVSSDAAFARLRSSKGQDQQSYEFSCAQVRNCLQGEVHESKENNDIKKRWSMTQSSQLKAERALHRFIFHFFFFLGGGGVRA